MRKQTKLVAVLSAAALLAVGASMTSFAAGWAQEDGIWVYLDKDGDRVTDTWKKSGANYYYLNEDGEMAVDTVVEDSDNNNNKYYVDASGARVTNRWVSVDNEDDEEIGGYDDITTIWYYFGANGRAYKAKDDEDYGVKTVDGKKYLFDDEGHMLSGWQIFVDENDNTKKTIYYLGSENEGWAATDWQYLEPSDDMDYPDSDGQYEDEEWFYFSTSNGKASTNKRQYIGGVYYTFDVNGVMQNKWVKGTPGAPEMSNYANLATLAGARYNESGAQATGWVKAYPISDPDEEGDDQFWYYLDGKGVPFNYGGKDSVASSTKVWKKNPDKVGGWNASITKVAAKVIKGKTYLFNGNGEMQTGVFYIGENTTDVVTRVGGADLDAGVYYFTKGGGSAEGSMVTGKVSVNYDGDTYNYYFKKSGQAYEKQIIDGTLYGRDGERVDAEDGNTYEKKNFNYAIKDKNGDVLVAAGVDVVVNGNGKIKKNGTVKIDGVKYEVNDYVATEAAEQ